VHDLQHDEHGVPSRFTMKLVEGQTLAELIARETDGGKKAPAVRALEQLLGIFLKICDAVGYAHSRGVIHRDLKPGNVMVGSHGQVYVMDWGIALRRSAAQTEEVADDAASQAYALPLEPPGTLCGTPAFMAPEQAWGRVDELDERTDVYGLGGILYAILTQSPPHDGGDSMADLEHAKHGQVAPPQQAAPLADLPPGLCRIAMRALSPNPDDRYASVELLRQDVEQFIRGGGWFATVRFDKGELIVREGDHPDAAYIVLQGQCELFRVQGDERRFMRLMGPGEVFGETSIFGSSRRTASVAASSEVTLLRVTREALDRELGRSEWLQAFVEALAERFIEVDQKLRRMQDR
jgi:serine/threonine-protein kinase